MLAEMNDHLSTNSPTNATRIMVVDDDDEMRLFVATVVASIWPDADIVEYDPLSDDQQEIETWERFDALVLDYHLGDSKQQKTGLDWLRRYRADPNFPPTILITDEATDNLAARAIQLGAADFIRKDDHFSTRLAASLREIHEQAHKPTEAGRSNAALQAHIKDLEQNRNVTANNIPRPTPALTNDTLTAMVIIKPDQFAALALGDGDEFASEIVTDMQDAIANWIVDNGGRVETIMYTNSAVYVTISGLIGPSHAEMIAGAIGHEMRTEGFGSQGATIRGSTSIGICMAHANTDPETKSLASRAAESLRKAELQGGNGYVIYGDDELHTSYEVRDSVMQEQEAARAAWSQASNDDAQQAEADFAMASINLQELIKEQQLSMLFKHVLSADQENELRYLQASTVLRNDQGRVMTAAFREEFMRDRGLEIEHDKIMISQSMTILTSSNTPKNIDILLDLSDAAVRSKDFLLWVAQKLRLSGLGQRFMFTVDWHPWEQGQIDANSLNSVQKATQCGFMLRARIDSDFDAEYPVKAPFDGVAVDLYGAMRGKHCRLVGELAERFKDSGIMVALRGIDTSDKLLCAYTTPVTLVQGLLAKKWAETDLVPLD